MAKSRGPLIALVLIVGTALTLTLTQLLSHQVSVRAADGSEVVIETDPARLPPPEPATRVDSIQRGGIEPGAKERAQLQEGSGR
jgi:hypothetical protein